MHELYNYACDELIELERKAADKGLSASELEYADKLTELKKNILKIDMLEDEGYSAEYRDDRGRSNRYDGGSYAGRRYARRDTMGRYSRRGYSRANDEIVGQLHEMMESAPDEHVRSEIKKLIDKMEKG